jgi:putative transposase
MTIKRTSHAVYDTKYHLVWAPKYRKWITREDIRQRGAELFREIAEEFQFEIEEMEVAKDHVQLFGEFPELRRQLWGGEFWEDGYFARTVGDQVTAEVIKKYIRYHRHEEHQVSQLELF